MFDKRTYEFAVRDVPQPYTEEHLAQESELFWSCAHEYAFTQHPEGLLPALIQIISRNDGALEATIAGEWRIAAKLERYREGVQAEMDSHPF